MLEPEVKRFTKRFTWAGYEWETCMESGRPIHPDLPSYYYDGNCVSIEQDNSVCLTMGYNPTVVRWWNKDWSEIVDYHPTIACGLIRSVEPFPLYGRFKCSATLPMGANLWPSFWSTSSETWPPEIDFFEAYSDDYGSYMNEYFSLHRRWPFFFRGLRIQPNVHYSVDGQHRQIGPVNICGCTTNFSGQPDFSRNEYACEVRPDIIRWTVNGKTVRVCRNKEVLEHIKTEGMHVIFNIWPTVDFDISENGDIEHLCAPYIIHDFKYER